MICSQPASRSFPTALIPVLVGTFGSLACNVPTGSEIPTTGASATDGDPYQFSFYLAEQNLYPFPENGCNSQTPVGVIGKPLADALKQKSWWGTYAGDVEDECNVADEPLVKCAVPDDFVESGLNLSSGMEGKDTLYADARGLAVFAGHGAHNELAYRRESPTSTQDVCSLQLTDHVWLGMSLGLKARVAMFAASCVGYAKDIEQGNNDQDFLDALGKTGTWQQLSFYDSPRLHGNQLPIFLDLLTEYDNNTAWVDSQHVYDYEQQLYNQPIVYSTTTEAEIAAKGIIALSDRHEDADLLAGTHLPAPSNTTPTQFMYTSVWNDGDPDTWDGIDADFDCWDAIQDN